MVSSRPTRARYIPDLIYLILSEGLSFLDLSSKVPCIALVFGVQDVEK